MACQQRLARSSPVLCLVEPPLTVIGTLLTLIRVALALLGKLFTFVRDSLTFVGEPLALVGDAVSFICAAPLFSQLPPFIGKLPADLLDARRIRSRRQLIRFDPRVRTVGWDVAHSSSIP